jgi:hypothetical protein
VQSQGIVVVKELNTRACQTPPPGGIYENKRDSGPYL